MILLEYPLISCAIMSSGHDRARTKICLICQDKAKLNYVIREGSKLQSLVNDFIIEGFTTMDRRLPQALCGSCRGKLVRFGKGDFSPTLPQLPSWEPMAKFRPSRSPACSCQICTISKESGRLGNRKRLSKLMVNTAFHHSQERILQLFYVTFSLANGLIRLLIVLSQLACASVV